LVKFADTSGGGSRGSGGVSDVESVAPGESSAGASQVATLGASTAVAMQLPDCSIAALLLFPGNARMRWNEME